MSRGKKWFGFFGAALSPSQVILIEMKNGRGGRFRTLDLDDGNAVSGVAVAAGHGDLMLLGPVFQPQILACRRGRHSGVP